jgi:two-component system, OmpR family, sensor kinase
MLMLCRIAAWPLVVKVPVLVAGLMITVAFTISQVVLWRSVQDQERNLRLLTSSYLDGLSAAILPATIRGDVWEVFDALDRSRTRYAAVETRFAVVVLPNGRVLAASDPLRFPVHSELPDPLRRRFAASDGLLIEAAIGRAWLTRTLSADGLLVGRLFAEIDIADLLRFRREILLMLVLVNGCLTLAFALGGYFVLRRMLQPFGVLSRHMQQIQEGCVEAIPGCQHMRVSSEFGQLFERFNAMAQALNERQILQSELADQEKYAMLGRLASGMAHEVNNPLGGMLNAIDTIQAHGNDPAVLQTSLDFLKRGLAGIRNVARAALVTYKGGSDTRLLTQSDLDDLPFLAQHETGARRLRLEWQNLISESLAIDGAAVRQITLNLFLNACAASPLGGRVAVTAWHSGGMLQITVADDGSGLPEEMATLLDQAAPATGTAQQSKGLGLWMTGHLIRSLGGHAVVEYPGIGTRVVVSLPVAPKEVFDAAA